MRENRPYGSEGGESQTLPDPYQEEAHVARPWIPASAGITVRHMTVTQIVL
jgi:hypothetical protein